MEMKSDTWKNITAVMLGTVNHESFFKARSVSVVSDELRKWNEDAYMPKVISIGPRHNGRKELLPMEEIKWRCMFHLFNRSPGYTISPDNRYINNCMEAILKIDVPVRSSYVGEIELDRYDLAAIMFNDGCFLLEFLISGSRIDSIIPPFAGRIGAIGPNPPAVGIGKMEVVMRDLTLLENQIPLFVLDVLFQNIFDKGFHYLIHEIHNRALSLFGFHGDPKSVDFKFAHFLELASWNINKEWEGLQMVENEKTQSESKVVGISEQVEYQYLNRCATKLKSFGVTIKPSQVNTLKFSMKFSDNDGILEIPPVHITREMKARWLNLIAWEHHKKWIKPKSSSDTGNENQDWRVATSSALLINDLLCCSSDVQLLKDRGVIVVDDDDLKKMSNRDLMEVFHSLTKGVDRGIMDPKYSSNFDALNKYSAANCITRILILLWHYVRRILSWFHTIWKFLRRDYNLIISAATFLTAVQTVYAILSYHLPKS